MLNFARLSQSSTWKELCEGQQGSYIHITFIYAYSIATRAGHSRQKYSLGWWFLHKILTWAHWNLQQIFVLNANMMARLYIRTMIFFVLADNVGKKCKISHKLLEEHRWLKPSNRKMKNKQFFQPQRLFKVRNKERKN